MGRLALARGSIKQGTGAAPPRRENQGAASSVVRPDLEILGHNGKLDVAPLRQQMGTPPCEVGVIRNGASTS